MFKAIADRRSIRRYRPDMVPKEMIEKVLEAGILAPSSKNRQPWKFFVTTGRAKEQMLAAMQQGLLREKDSPLLPQSRQYCSGAEQTLKIMCQAPVVILIVNPLGQSPQYPLAWEERVYEICNAQSVGAAVENMVLAATELGLGSLWICDTYFAYPELCGWLDTEGELFAAMALGYADENPHPRPRHRFCDVVEWRE